MISSWLPVGCLVLGAGLSACTNNPYPHADEGRKILYSSFSEAPKTLDPAVAYTTAAHVITGNVYDTLLEYHYLARPYRLIPGLATAMPKQKLLEDGRVAYRFEIRDGVRFHADPCFETVAKDRRTRDVTASDFAFALARIADPAVNSPVARNFGVISGFEVFQDHLRELRASHEGFAELPAREQYSRAGGIEGVRVLGALELEIALDAADPQILYWFAMPFTTPVPWEAVAYYDGEDGRDHFNDHPVGTGPFRLALYRKRHRFVLQRNEAWYGRTQVAPGTTFPRAIPAESVRAGRIDAAYAGRALPFIERIEFRREREDIPRFNKFLQGYYDDGGIVKESFDTVVQGDRLSPEMAAKGMRLDKTVEPSIFYIGFNMNDPVIGHAAGARGRLLRQAMSLVIDAERYLELFFSGRGVPAQSPLPPGLFGYDPDYRNPFRKVDVARASALLAEAGYAKGIDPRTGRPLKLTFDTSDTTAQGLLRYKFLVSAWRQIGLDVTVKATTYNQFQQKVRRGAYQLFIWGWIADYPDPENFLFLLDSASGRARSGGPNTANFSDPAYDALFAEMKDRTNDEERRRLIRRMVEIVERERPWIELFHNEAYKLSHGWLVNSRPMGISYPAFKYQDVRPRRRALKRAEWNRPVVWPLYLLLLAVGAAFAPAVVTFYRERQ